MYPDLARSLTSDGYTINGGELHLVEEMITTEPDKQTKVEDRKMRSIVENAFHLLQTMKEAPLEEWISKFGLGRLGMKVERLVELSGLSLIEARVAITWLVNQNAIEVSEDPDPDREFEYRWIKRITSQGELLYEQMREAKEMSNHESSESAQAAVIRDTAKVFVVHGRNSRARNALFTFLRSLHLRPLEWTQAVQATGKASPYIGEILDAAFAEAQAIVVLMTPDDMAYLREPLRNSGDPPYESEPTPQARPNVLFEAGMAMGRNPDRTVLVELGNLRPFSDVAGRHTIRFENTVAKRQALAQRLQTAGCSVDMSGTDWHNDSDFDAALEGL